MKILVTGGAGFIGSHLVDQLISDKHQVVVVDEFNNYYDPQIKAQNLAPALASGACELIRQDIVDFKGLEAVFKTHSIDAIVHLAARAGVRPSIVEPDLYNRVNIIGTTNLLELARLYKVKKFVFGSSSSVYGLSDRIPFREDDPLFYPISPYAATKVAGEKLAHTYHHLYGIDMVCLRFFTVYGPRQRPDLAIHKFTRAIHEGRSIDQYGDGGTKRDYTYVSDIVQGVTSAVYQPFKFEIFNLGESQTVSLKQLITEIETALGKKAVIRQLPEQPGDVPITYADITRAREILGYKPMVKIDQGIPLFVEWFMEKEKVLTAQKN